VSRSGLEPETLRVLLIPHHTPRERLCILRRNRSAPVTSSRCYRPAASRSARCDHGGHLAATPIPAARVARCGCLAEPIERSVRPWEPRGGRGFECRHGAVLCSLGPARTLQFQPAPHARNRFAKEDARHARRRHRGPPVPAIGRPARRGPRYSGWQVTDRILVGLPQTRLAGRDSPTETTRPPQHPTATNPWAILAVVALGTFMTSLDSSIVNISLPSMARGFGVPLSAPLNGCPSSTSW
jgi:hypothetical protein